MKKTSPKRTPSQPTAPSNHGRGIAIVKGVIYVVVLGVVCAYVLLEFLKPTQQHIGINQYENAMFLAMVDGTAYQPYVHRRLLPGLVHWVSRMTPEETQGWFFRWVDGSANLRLAFSVFNWEPRAAFQYTLASLAMLISLIGFGHYGAKFTLVTCNIPDRKGMYHFVVSIALVGLLIPFFKYASYIYDPPQLFLFTMALYFLAASRLRAFVIVFIFCCLNKETAVLLIPLALWTYYGQMPRRHFAVLLAGLVGGFVAIKLSLTLLFRSNPGGVVELHLWDHNLPWFTQTMSYSHVIVGTVLLGMVLYHWKEKPLLLRRALICTAPWLVLFTLFLGYIDEWRDYYEVYPVGFALTIDSLRRMKRLAMSQLATSPFRTG